MPTNNLNCHSEERSRPQAGVATRYSAPSSGFCSMNLLFRPSAAKTVHFIWNGKLHTSAEQIFQ